MIDLQVGYINAEFYENIMVEFSNCYKYITAECYKYIKAECYEYIYVVWY